MQQYIGFNLNDGEYTIPILKVREIISLPPITKMPQSPSYIEGVANIRGSIIPIVNIKRLANLDGSEKKGDKVIIIASGKMVFGILVDGITGVINIDETAIEPPENVINKASDLIGGVIKLDSRILVLLDTSGLIPYEDRSIFDEVLEVKESGHGKVEVVKTVQTIGGEVRVSELRDAKEFLEKRMGGPIEANTVMARIIEFMDAIANQDYTRAEEAIEKISTKGQDELFKEVGRVTRKLHDSLKSFKESIDPRLTEITTIDMPNAIDRLQFVIDKTEEAANRTMGIVEKYILGMDELSSHIRNLKEPEESVNYLKGFKNRLEDDLTEILTTQSFQDITGQTIKKVISLVGDIEEELVKLIATFGVKVEDGKKVESISEKVSQEDVDDLLKEFGF
ncbi:MAG: protein phosphatase CheZ [Thermodesulfovibrionales bacterium]